MNSSLSNITSIEHEEGVIKFQVAHKDTPPLEHPLLLELNAWRNLLFKVGLTGQDPRRYGGLGYGNFSIRENARQFLISGTQTGAITELGKEHYVRILSADLTQNRVESQGPLPPSSETMTHAAVYAANPQIECVFHVHHPIIWRVSEKLCVPETPPDILYGTVAMAREIGALIRSHHGPVIAMKGHEDGLIAIGCTLKDAGGAIMDILAKALALPSHPLK
jgi:hypothetical protein